MSINYQLNRFSDGSPESVAELGAAAPRSSDYADYTRELLTLSDAAYANWRRARVGRDGIRQPVLFP